MKKIISLLFLITILFIPPVFAQEEEYDFKSQEFKEVASQFMCMCGCSQDHYECNMQGCGLNDSFKTEIKDMMDDGLTKDDIKEYYIGIYGEEILTAPEKKGFSLTAWILPFAVLGIAGTGIMVTIRKWINKNRNDDLVIDTRSEEEVVEDEITRSMIDQERKKYF